LIDNIGVTAFADLVTGMRHRAGCHLRDCISTIVSVLAEGLGNNSGAQDDEGDDRDQHHGGEPKKVFYVFEQKFFTFGAGIARLVAARRKRNDLRYRESVEGTMIEVTGASDPSHALDHKRRQDRESLNEFDGIERQTRVLAEEATARKLRDGNHTTRSFFGYQISSYFFPEKMNCFGLSRIQVTGFFF
jgi:hypothetical protein